jgi:hypothetical protein
MARTKQVPRITGARGMPPLAAGRRKKAPSPQTPPEKKKKAGRRESPRLAAAPPAKKTVVTKHKKAVKPQLPTKKPEAKLKKLPKAIARAVAIEAVVEKDQALNFPTPPGAAAKGTHFSTTDDECICTAYGEVSEDQIKGANMKGEEFWAAVGARANEKMAKLGRPERANDSIQNRFQKKIQPKALTFKAYYKEAMKSEQSGWNEDNYEKCALELYENDEGAKYPYIECSRILKCIPKYDWEHESDGEGTGGTTGGGAPMGGGMDRPKGTKGARKTASKRKADSSLDNTESTGKMHRELRKIRERTENYFDFNMLLRLGRRDEANALFEQVRGGRQHQLPSSVPAAASLPQPNYNDDDSSNSSERSTVERFLVSHYAADGVEDDQGVQIQHSDSETSSESGESSGGDRKAAADRAKKMVEGLTPV